MLPDLEQFDLVYAETIYELGEPIKYIYFLESGIVSLISFVEEQAKLEVGMVGNEGSVGLSVFLGAKKSDNQAIVKGKGIALKMSDTNFLKECELGGKLPKLLQRYTNSFLTQVTQSAVCNRYHTIEPRLARWLLMSHDHMKTKEFEMTQEFLSNMLGVRRETFNREKY